MKTKQILVGLPLACDYIPTDRLQQPDSPTVRRINACVKTMECLKPGLQHCFIVCTAGFTKLSPFEKPASNVPELPLCEQMQRYIHTNFVQDITVVSAVKGWGTESEVCEGIQLARDRVDSASDVTLVVSTNRAHMVRVRIYVWKYLPKGWKVKYVRAHHHFSFASHKREPVGALHAFIFALRYKVLGK